MSPARTAGTIVEEITISAPAERIFEALSIPEQCVKWWGSRAQFGRTHVESDLRLGGRLVVRGFGGGGKSVSVTGVYRQIERPRLLVTRGVRTGRATPQRVWCAGISRSGAASRGYARRIPA